MNRISRHLINRCVSTIVCNKYVPISHINITINKFHSTMMTNNNIKSTTPAVTTTGATTGATNKPKVDLKAPIILTERAASRIKEMIKDKDDTVGVKISVKRRGCNGYSYMMNYAQTKDVEAKKDDIVMAHGVTVLVDPKAIFYIVGTVMDYEETDLSTEFTFTNPNSKGECGCGESFNV